MGNFSINHYSALEVTEDEIQVRYILDFAEIPTFQERQLMDADADGAISAAEEQRYLTNKIPALAEGLLLKLAGERQALAARSQQLSFPEGAGGLPTMRLDIVFHAPLQAPLVQTSDESMSLQYVDHNYRPRAGWREMSAKAASGMTLIGSNLPEKGSELLSYPDIENSAPPQISETAFSFRRGPGTPEARAIAEETVTAASATRGDAFTQLLDGAVPSGQHLLWVLFAALGLGAAHALSPGHGKTLVAAYLVGSQGTVWHALLLGITVTFSHTIGVFLLGFVTLYLSDVIVPEQLYPWLSRLSGLTILIIGLSIFRKRWIALRQPKPAHGHHHHHAPKSSGLKGILGLGISGGIIPCPSALVVLLSAVAFHQVGFGLLLIVAFSLGLAATLVAVGLSVVYLGTIFKGAGRFSPVVRFLPPVSAAGMAVLGGLIAFGVTGSF